MTENQSPASPALLSRDNRAFWRTMITFVVGFSLPVLACFGLLITSALALNVMSAGGGTPAIRSGTGSGPGVALIRVEGVIQSGQAGVLAENVAASRTLVGLIERAAEDGDVKAIVLAVNSPGGGVVASDEIYHALKQVDKPIVVSMGDLAASGGYYISMAADWIVANPNTLTGSIGVISEFPNADGLLDKIGVEFVVIKSGEHKDIASPFRDMTAEEVALWQKIIDETYAGFVQIVAEGRRMPEDRVRQLADGSVYTGRQALDFGLVDALGYEDDAIAKAGELGGIQGKPRVIEYKPEPGVLDYLAGFASSGSALPSLSEIIGWIGHPSLSARYLGP